RSSRWERAPGGGASESRPSIARSAGDFSATRPRVPAQSAIAPACRPFSPRRASRSRGSRTPRPGRATGSTCKLPFRFERNPFMNPQTALYGVAFLLSTVFSAFFAGSETALVSLSRIDLQRMREKGDRRGLMIRNLRAHTAKLLAVILIGQNLFMSAASASATNLATRFFGERSGFFGAILASTLPPCIFAALM